MKGNIVSNKERMENMNSNNYLKKFSVGLTLLDSVEEYDAFLRDYGKYITNIYFSLPMGDRFHSRVMFKNLLKDEKYIDLFWDLLLCIQKHSIDLELLFNTSGLSEEDVKNSCILLEQHGVCVKKIGILDEYYDLVRKYFPEQELVYSFNNFPNTVEQYANISNPYDEVVVARQFIRDQKVFSLIKQKLKSKVVLLVNNGCSQVCGGCKSQWHCHDSYYREHAKYSAEYQYALQSVFPFEINEGYLDMSNVDYIKIASRNDNLLYVRKCIDSYINNESYGYVESNRQNYLLWSRLQWHTDYFHSFDYNRLVDLKKKIYSGSITSEEVTVITSICVGLDLRDYFTLSNIELTDDKFYRYLHSLKQYINNEQIQMDLITFGCESCDKLLKIIDFSVLSKNINYAKSKGLKVAFELPPMNHTGAKSLSREIISRFGEEFNYLVINDEDTLKAILGIEKKPKIVLGRAFDRVSVQKNLAKNVCASTNFEKRNLIGEHTRQLCGMFGIDDIMIDIPRSGLFVSNNEHMDIWCSISNRLVDRNPICVRDISMGDLCECGCLIPSNKESFTDIDIGNRRLGRVIYENINIKTPGVYSTLLEQRVKYIYMPWDEEYLKGWS